MLGRDSLVLPGRCCVERSILGRVGNSFSAIVSSFARRSRGLSAVRSTTKRGLGRTFSFIRSMFSSNRRVLIFIARLAVAPRVDDFLTRGRYRGFSVCGRGLVIKDGEAELLGRLREWVLLVCTKGV